MAPSTIAKAPGQKVKTDRMDARLLAKTLAFKTYSPVCLPSEKLEAIKEYTRVRTAKITMLKKDKAEPPFFPAANGLALSSERPLLDAGSHGLAQDDELR
nr:transposase [Treponema succinifaciens]